MKSRAREAAASMLACSLLAACLHMHMHARSMVREDMGVRPSGPMKFDAPVSRSPASGPAGGGRRRAAKL